MMKKIYTVMVMVCIGLGAVAQVMAPGLRARLMQTASDSRVEAFVRLDRDVVESLRACGLSVDMQLGDIALVSGDKQALARASSQSGVRSMEAPRRVHLLCDESRSYTHVTQVLEGTGLPAGYDGTGVVLGMIDCGIEYQHLAFMDSAGNSRISRVYHPADSSGTVMVDGVEQRGVEYTTPEQIATLTTDDSTQGHGTHTTGIAAGSLVGNYGGMAPGAEIVIVGIPADELTTYNVVMGMQYIASYAAGVGRPCVINMSLGSHDGPHDGTGVLQDVMELLNKQYGTLFVCSAGNEATDPLYLHKILSADDNTLSTVMYKYGSNTANTEVWSRTASPLSICYSVYNSTQREIVSTTIPLTTDTVFDLSQDDNMSEYFTGTLTIAQGVGENGRYYIHTSHDATPRSTNYYLAFTVTGNDGDEVDVWDADQTTNFNSCGLEGYSTGTGEYSISDMATGGCCISVGASTARTTYPVGSGSRSTGYSLGEMGRFSSYGTEPSGLVHPIVVAPGVQVVSAVSNYNCSKSYYSQHVDNDYWYVKSGTSMSAPHVAGILALWLQACPSLTLEQAKTVIANTSYLDPDGSAQRGVNGEINALDGLLYILDNFLPKTGDVNADDAIDVSDENITVNIVLGLDDNANYDGRADINGDGEGDISVGNILINLFLNK